jgi:hypothetical protein
MLEENKPLPKPHLRVKVQNLRDFDAYNSIERKVQIYRARIFLKGKTGLKES